MTPSERSFSLVLKTRLPFIVEKNLGFGWLKLEHEKWPSAHSFEIRSIHRKDFRVSSFILAHPCFHLDWMCGDYDYGDDESAHDDYGDAAHDGW